MRQPNNYLTNSVTLPNAFTSEECKKIIAFEGIKQDGSVGAKERGRVDKSVRKSILTSISFNDSTAWFYQKLQQMIVYANQNFFKFEIDGLADVNVIEYPLNGFYDWHRDLGYSQASFRKLSIVLFLSQPGSDFQGGELIFQGQHFHKQERGTLFIFPPYLLHKVNPVTQGTRYTLVAWATGPSFR